MIFYSKQNVYEAAKDRIRYLFDEFPDRKKVVTFSGGKDSTTVLHLVKEVMDERGIDKIAVFFCDQELESPMCIDYVRYVMHLPWVEPYWVQSYFREWNSSKGDWFNVWGPGEKWCREKEPDSIHDLDQKVKEHFGQVLDSMQRKLFGDDYVCFGGVRIEESPMRRLGLTGSVCYKDITWGAFKKHGDKTAYLFYPIWDWSANDVWYYIISNHHKYCQLYNYYFTQRSLVKSRVSSYIHENSIQDLKYMKEIAPEFYERAIRRVENVNTTVQTYNHLCQYVTSLPPYFASWPEYVDYLSKTIVTGSKNGERIVKAYTYQCKRLTELCDEYNMADYKPNVIERLGICAACCCITEDFECSQLANIAYTVRTNIVQEYHARNRKIAQGEV